MIGTTTATALAPERRTSTLGPDRRTLPQWAVGSRRGQIGRPPTRPVWRIGEGRIGLVEIVTARGAVPAGTPTVTAIGAKGTARRLGPASQIVLSGLVVASGGSGVSLSGGIAVVVLGAIPATKRTSTSPPAALVTVVALTPDADRPTSPAIGTTVERPCVHVQLALPVGATARQVSRRWQVGSPLYGVVGSAPVGRDRTGQSWIVGASGARGTVSQFEIASPADIAERSWVDLHDVDGLDVETVEITGGRRRLFDRHEARKAVVVVRDDARQLDPRNLDGPYVVNGRTLIRPMRRMRIVADWQGTRHTLFTGFLDSPSPTRIGPESSRTTLVATDGFKVAAQVDQRAGNVVGQGESAVARIHRILDRIGWSRASRRISTTGPAFPVGATSSAQNALAELGTVVASTLGTLYVDRSGQFVYRSFVDRLTDPSSVNVQASFADDETLGLVYEDAVGSWDEQSIRNVVSYARAGGTAQTVRDEESIKEYFERSDTRTDFINTNDDDVRRLATAALAIQSQPEWRFASVALAPQLDPALWAPILALDYGDRVAVTQDGTTRHSHVEGVRQVITPRNWTTELALVDAERLAPALADIFAGA